MIRYLDAPLKSKVDAISFFQDERKVRNRTNTSGRPYVFRTFLYSQLHPEEIHGQARDFEVQQKIALDQNGIKSNKGQIPCLFDTVK
jgi:hypothetical protein